MAPRSRSAEAGPWYCKWCKHEPTGTSWINRGDQKWCGKCGIPKGSAFQGVPPPKVPVQRSHDMATKREKLLTKQLEELQQRMQKMVVSQNGTVVEPKEPAIPPWAKGTDAAVKRERLTKLG
eukprot:7135466-Pyramimonas_sp.AAC.1